MGHVRKIAGHWVLPWKRHPLVSQTFRKDLDLWSSKLKIFFWKNAHRVFWGDISNSKTVTQSDSENNPGKSPLFVGVLRLNKTHLFFYLQKGDPIWPLSLDSRNLMDDGLKVPTFAWGLRCLRCVGHWMWSPIFQGCLHPGRLTWNIIMEVWKIIFLSKWVICRFYVNLPGCNVLGCYDFLPSEYQWHFERKALWVVVPPSLPMEMLQQIHLRYLTCTPKMAIFKRSRLFQTIILGIHVSFQGCKYVFVDSSWKPHPKLSQPMEAPVSAPWKPAFPWPPPPCPSFRPA